MNKVQDDLVTKKYLDTRLTEFKKELKEEFKEEFPTKVDLRNELKSYATKDDLHDMAETILGSVNKMFVKVNQTILDSHDAIMKRIDDLSAENAAGFLQHRRLEKRVENHEKRLKILEKAN